MLSVSVGPRQCCRCVDGYLGQYHHGLVYCIDNLQHTATTAQRVIDTAAQLGLSDYLEMRDADAYEYANELADEEEEGALGLLWVSMRFFMCECSEIDQLCA